MKSVEYILVEMFDWSDASGLCYAVRFGPTWHSAESRLRRARGFAACRLSVGRPRRRWVPARAIDPRCGGGGDSTPASRARPQWPIGPHRAGPPPTDVPATSSRPGSERFILGDYLLVKA